jgi:hypothetical protein
MAKKLEKLINVYHPGAYKTKMSDLDLWFDILNNLIFNNRIPAFRYNHIQSMRDCVGCVIMEDESRDSKWMDLYVLPKYKDFKTFVEVLAHEMVHAYQYWIIKDSCNHNENFYRWRSKFRSAGIKLSLTVDNVDIK